MNAKLYYELCLPRDLKTVVFREYEMAEERRLHLLKIARKKSGYSLDFWSDFTDGLSIKALEILVGRSSMLPKYRNSKDKP